MFSRKRFVLSDSIDGVLIFFIKKKVYGRDICTKMFTAVLFKMRKIGNNLNFPN